VVNAKKVLSRFSMIMPVFAASMLGLVLSNLTMSDQPMAIANPFDDVRVVAPIVESDIGPSVVETDVEAEAYALPESLAKTPATEPQMPFGEAGYVPQVSSDGECVCTCDCLDERAIRKIVSDEFNNQKLAEQVAPRGYSTQSVTYTQPTVAYQSPSVTYQQTVQPTQATTQRIVRRGPFGRVYYQTVPASSSGTCRVVNGVTVCN
jgi:hypothetical protein